MKLSLLLWLATLAVIGFLLWYIDRLTGQRDSANSALSEKSDSIRYFVSESGKMISSKAAAEITKADLEEHYADLAADLKDMQIKLSQVKALFKAVVEANGEGAVRVVRDTVRVSDGPSLTSDSLFIDDKYLSLKAVIPGNRYRYTYRDSIIFAIEGKKRWLLGQERLYGTARFSNPNARALNQTAVLIREREKRLVISAGVSYMPFSGEFAPSVHIGYALFKF